MDYLLEHVKIDLQESLGEIPFIIQYVNCFKQALPQKYMPGKEYEIHEDAFDRIKDRFFDKITITVQVEREDDFMAPEHGASGEYYPESHITPEGKLSHPEIYIRLRTGMGYMIRNLLSRTFAHEMTHAYEDYQRLLKGKKGLKKYAEEHKYDDLAYALQNYKNRYQKLMSYSVYLLIDPERNANIGRLRQDLEGKPLKTYEQIKKSIKSTQVYQAYNIIADFLKELDRVYTDQDWEDYVKEDLEELTGYKFKTVRQAQKWLFNSWRKFQRTFENRVGKIIADMRDREEHGLDHGYVEDSDMFRPGSDFWEDIEPNEDMPDWLMEGCFNWGKNLKKNLYEEKYGPIVGPWLQNFENRDNDVKASSEAKSKYEMLQEFFKDFQDDVPLWIQEDYVKGSNFRKDYLLETLKSHDWRDMWKHIQKAFGDHAKEIGFLGKEGKLASLGWRPTGTKEEPCMEFFAKLEDKDSKERQTLENIVKFYGYFISSVNYPRVVMEPEFPEDASDYVFNTCKGQAYVIVSKNVADYVEKLGLRCKNGSLRDWIDMYIQKHGVEPTKEQIKTLYKPYRYFPKRIYFCAFEPEIDEMEALRETCEELFFSLEDSVVFSIQFHDYRPKIYQDPAMNSRHAFFTYNNIPAKYLKRIYN